MSLLINDDLIWVSIPKCASQSIESAFYNSGLKVQHIFYGYKNKPEKHSHIPLSILYNNFGIKNSVCIKRDYFERWLSSLRYIWQKIEENNMIPIINWSDIDNDFIFKFFDDKFIDDIHSTVIGEMHDFENHSLIKEKIHNLDIKFLKDKNSNWFTENALYGIFYSQSHWLNGKRCTYEFDIKEIDKFEKFISERYLMNFKIPFLNKGINYPSKIIPNQELKNWVFENFEKRYTTSIKII